MVDASLWDDASEWEARLERHPLVRDARIRRSACPGRCADERMIAS